jgi:hypothetical protein
MATTNPARAGRVERASDSDRVRFEMVDGRVEILETYFNGQRVYSR